jgi:hypothetical protein
MPTARWNHDFHTSIVRRFIDIDGVVRGIASDARDLPFNLLDESTLEDCCTNAVCRRP